MSQTSNGHQASVGSDDGLALKGDRPLPELIIAWLGDTYTYTRHSAAVS